MEIILKQDVENLGHRDDIVNVKPGYGRNYLIPQGYAILATETAKKIHAENMKQRAHKEAKLREEAEALAAKMEGLELTIATKTSSTGKIFGSINTIMLAEALAAKGFEIDRKNILMKDKSIKEVGKYNAAVRLYKNIKANFSFNVITEAE
ncbi:MAG: 50S ribosomal protein L9 [Bacteroidales bacterium]|jgi:large subunit ribosomal protein L9|nr:50S ribosomal protein L9 [Bacteroidales bacterium]MBQ2573552.1 50S ribosomal protein L9 [Bacteroidales bacterium]MBQ3989303.1 50S ribosomal protein L9 [Bacteroidales bacterium]MBQ4474928.1 50S ribosomal protein L9 [Bacteroidales bacterium]MBQ5424078.1 50S ribosomal protein L9 [Bacteroidales bacterium]